MADQRRIDEFLDLYKQLEDELEDKYRNSRRHYSSVVFEFARDDDSLPVREILLESMTSMSRSTRWPRWAFITWSALVA